MHELDQNVDLELPVDDSDDQDRVVDLDLGQDIGRSQPTIITSTPRRNRSRSRSRPIDLGEHAQPSISRARSSSNDSVNKNESDPDNESDDDEGSETEVDITLPRLQEIPDLVTNESLTRSEGKMIMYMEEDHIEFSNRRMLADISQVVSLIAASFPCPQCFRNGTLNTIVKEARGLAIQLAVECNETVKTWWSSETETAGPNRRGRKAFKVNKGCTLGSLSRGMGAHSFQRLCENLDLPCHRRRRTGVWRRDVLRGTSSVLLLLF